MLHETMGEYFVNNGYLTRDQLHEVLAYQRKRPAKLFGQIAIELGYLSEQHISSYFKNRR